MNARHGWILGVTLAACGGPPAGSDDSSSSEGENSSSGETTVTPTSGEASSSSSTGEESSSSESSGSESSSSTEPPPDPLPPLVDPVELTDKTLRVPVHAEDEEWVLDVRLVDQLAEAMAQGYGEITLETGEPVTQRTLDDSEPPAPGDAAKLLVRFVHLADTQLSDDESPGRVVNFDELAGGAFRPEETYFCRMLNAAVRTINRVNEDLPLDFVILGGDNTDSAQTNELEWFMGILNGAPAVECDSAVDDDPIPGPDNDPKDRFAPVGLDVPWRWVTGNHDILHQGTWPIEDYASDVLSGEALYGTRDWSQPGGPIVVGPVPADPNRALLEESDQLQRIADDGDGHGITAEALAIGEAYYTFDVEGTPLRFFVMNTAAETGASKGLIRQADIDAIIEPILLDAAAADKAVILASHHRADSLANGTEQTIGEEFADALTTEEWIAYVGTHEHVILHLAAHSHTMHVQARTPMGGHAYWEIAAPALADFPSQVRLFEIYDQDNGHFSIRTTAFDFVADDDPIAEMGRTIAVVDFTTGWSGDGRGPEPIDRNVEVWIPKP
jgi:hypothetical protein